MAQSVGTHDYVFIGNLDVYKNCAECVEELAEVTGPKAKFFALDQLTTKAFQHHVFTQLEGLSRSRRLSQYAENSAQHYGWDTPLGGHSPKETVAVAEEIVRNCMQLSEKVMESINLEEKSRLYSVCSNPDTYIESKTIHALEKFINSSNFKSKVSPDHPMHSLYKKYSVLKLSKHLESCPCHNMISCALNTRDLMVTDPSTSTSSSVQMASSSAFYAKNSHFKKCYFTEINFPLENGATLGICYPPCWEDQPLLFTSNDNKKWNVEFPIEEQFKYVIVKDGQLYTEGSNRYLTFGDTCQADDPPRF